MDYVEIDEITDIDQHIKPGRDYVRLLLNNAKIHDYKSAELIIESHEDFANYLSDYQKTRPQKLELIVARRNGSMLYKGRRRQNFVPLLSISGTLPGEQQSNTNHPPKQRTMNAPEYTPDFSSSQLNGMNDAGKEGSLLYLQNEVNRLRAENSKLDAKVDKYESTNEELKEKKWELERQLRDAEHDLQKAKDNKEMFKEIANKIGPGMAEKLPTILAAFGKGNAAPQQQAALGNIQGTKAALLEQIQYFDDNSINLLRHIAVLLDTTDANSGFTQELTAIINKYSPNKQTA